jgi:hypothetical protein
MTGNYADLYEFGQVPGDGRFSEARYLGELSNRREASTGTIGKSD